MSFTVIFYEEDNGVQPVRDFLLRMTNHRMQAKTFAMLELLEEKGNALREPYTKHLEEGIFELRTQVKNDALRTLFFYEENKIIVLAHIFMKKTRKTPRREIEVAKKRRAIYTSRKES